jgi:hypothetical protein
VCGAASRGSRHRVAALPPPIGPKPNDRGWPIVAARRGNTQRGRKRLDGVAHIIGIDHIAGNTRLTVIAGPLSNVGISPKVTCHAPQPSP